MDPKSLRYASSHEWAAQEGDVCTVGITAFAAEQLNDITELELPEVGTPVSVGGRFGEVEAVKAVSDLYSPVDGEVAEVNAALAGDDKSPINDDPFGAGWLIKVKLKPGAGLDHLLSYEDYQKQIESEG